MNLIWSKEIFLASEDRDKFVIRSISFQDIELLRIWKNDHRNSFFFKEIITPEMQENWFQSYSKRRHDFMMIGLQEDEKIGCIGFRLLNDRVDVYNVILGQKKYAKMGYMANALKLVCKEAMKRYPNIPIIASVLKTNPALQWYYRRGFVAIDEYNEHFDVMFPESIF